MLSHLFRCLLLPFGSKYVAVSVSGEGFLFWGLQRRYPNILGPYQVPLILGNAYVNKTYFGV